jgi:hypothetical protein
MIVAGCVPRSVRPGPLDEEHGIATVRLGSPAHEAAAAQQRYGPLCLIEVRTRTGARILGPIREPLTEVPLELDAGRHTLLVTRCERHCGDPAIFHFTFDAQSGHEYRAQVFWGMNASDARIVRASLTDEATGEVLTEDERVECKTGSQ